ncbi:MAG: hypothetical protein IKE90_00195 [Bacilli bacterium]|nr:hypothetical protein [Bacilli bacterium]
MIISQNNKDFILKGKMKRGFNQTPEEIKNKLNNLNVEEKKDDQNKSVEDYFKLKKARNTLKRF